MSVNFDVDDAESDYMAGYLRGISTTIDTSDYIDSALDFTYRELKNRFEMDVDQMAYMNEDMWYHVYEWGDSWADRKGNSGNPARRLWKLTSVGRGDSRAVGFTFLPSVKPSPIHPEEEKRGVEADKHIFTWKAPVMEYGMTVTISPVEALKGMLVFYWEKEEKVVATSKTIVTKTDPNVVGVFTAYFVKWWNATGPAIFDRDIRPVLERDIVPRGAGGRFLPGRTKAQSRALATGRGAGTRQAVNIMSKDERKGEADARRAMNLVAAGYKQGRGGYSNHGHE